MDEIVVIGLSVLTSIAILMLTSLGLAVVFGLMVDQVYAAFGLSAQAMVGQASEIVPLWAGLIGALVIVLISAKPIFKAIQARVKPDKPSPPLVQIQDKMELTPVAEPCDCGPT